jgi:hypothetical protein
VFASEFADWDWDEWKKVIFTDECSIKLGYGKRNHRSFGLIDMVRSGRECSYNLYERKKHLSYDLGSNLGGSEDGFTTIS